MIITSLIGPKKQIGIVTRKVLLVDDVYDLDIRLPEQGLFKAGQYVSLKVTDGGVRRSYSVASYENGVIKLIVDIRPAGLGSKLVERLKIGDGVEVMGFLGRFVLEKEVIEKTDRVYFIATGTGIVPFLPMITKLLEDGFKKEVVLWWGVRHVKGVYWQEEFQRLRNKYSNFSYEIYLSQPEKEWSGKKGHVGDDLDKTLADKSLWYLCGSTGMIEDMKGKLKGMGVDDDFINYEKFF